VASAMTAIALLSPAWARASDKETASHIANVLVNSGRLHDYDFGVKYKNGSATLIGRVSSEEQKALAAEMAEQMPEVSQVVNQLEVVEAERAPKPLARLATGAPKLVPQGVVRAANRAGKATAKRTVDSAVQATAGELELGSDEPPARALPMLRSNSSQRRPSNQPANQAGRGQAPRGQAARAPVGRGQSQQAARTKNGSQPAGGQQLRGPQGQAVQLIPVVQGPNGTLIPLRQAQAAQQAPGQAQARQPRQRPYGFRTAAAQMPTMVGEAGPRGPMPAYLPASNAGAAPTTYDQPAMPNYSWPSYAAYPNYAGLTYPKQYSPTAWPYIGPFYPYPQVPLGWRKISLEWHDGWWFLDFDDQN
jgi:hypothetical protein